MADAPPFTSEYTFEYGDLHEIAPGVRRLVANNPSHYTFKGTNTYVVGRGQVAVVDPGPDDAEHREALMGALGRNGERVTHIFLTHTHRDHCGSYTRLAEMTGADVLGYGASAEASRTALAGSGGEPHLEADFVPARALRGGERIAGGDWELEAVHTPGHTPDHLCYAVTGGGGLFSGDHVMGWNTTVIAPPEGSMADYLRSLELLIARSEDVYFPGHGGHVVQGRRLAKAFIMHRRWREAQILECLRDGCDTIESMIPRIYEGLAENLAAAAAYSVLGHLDMMTATGTVKCQGRPSLTARYWPVDAQ